MEQINPFLIFNLDCDSTLALLTICLRNRGFHTLHSFELNSACASFSDPTCPHHPGQTCECRLVTLAVYREDIGVIPLVLHGHAYKTEISNVSARLLPVVLMDCLEQTHHEEQVLKTRLSLSEQA
jgi:hypothetical protein